MKSENEDVWRKKKKEEKKTIQTLTKLIEGWLALGPFSPDTWLLVCFERYWRPKILTIFPRVQNGTGWTVPYENNLYVNPFLWTAWTIPNRARWTVPVEKTVDVTTALIFLKFFHLHQKYENYFKIPWNTNIFSRCFQCFRIIIPKFLQISHFWQLFPVFHSSYVKISPNFLDIFLKFNHNF